MPNTHQRAHQLEEAFDAFNQMSIQLESSYRELENQVAQLNRELAAARSERLKQLAEKERLADRLERLLELLPGGVVVLDDVGRITKSNPVAEELFGMSLTGETWQSVIEQTFRQTGTDCAEVTLQSGKRVTISTRALDTEDGQIVLIMDVSNQHALQEMLNRQDRLAAMGEMAASLAHQIRTPLSSALLYASHFRKDDLSASDRNRFAEKIIGRMKHLEHMVNDMLQFARGGSFGMEKLSLRSLFDELQQMLSPQLAAVQGRLSVSDIHEELCIEGNREALIGALLNLANNSIEAKGQDVEISWSIRLEPGQGVLIEVQDNGPGIEAEIRDRIFTPFFTTRSDGTGLGLAVVQSIIHAHGGQVRLCSSTGQGTKFEIQLPSFDGNYALSSGLADPASNLKRPVSIRYSN